MSSDLLEDIVWELEISLDNHRTLLQRALDAGRVVDKKVDRTLLIEVSETGWKNTIEIQTKLLERVLAALDAKIASEGSDKV
jgi:hypothetical protein